MLTKGNLIHSQMFPIVFREVPRDKSVLRERGAADALHVARLIRHVLVQLTLRHSRRDFLTGKYLHNKELTSFSESLNNQ